MAPADEHQLYREDPEWWALLKLWKYGSKVKKAALWGALDERERKRLRETEK